MAQISRVRTVMTVCVAWCAALAAGNCVLTQHVAEHFRYAPALGTPLIGHFYQPWAWLHWQHAYYQYGPQFFGQLYVYAILGFGASVLALVLMVGFITRRMLRNDNVHGSAHFAIPDEVHRSGLVPRKPRWLGKPKPGAGVYIGGYMDCDRDKTLLYLRHDGPEHILSVAPTRSGKGVGQVMPTLLSWPHSCFVTDLKGELWAKTAGYRQTIGPVLRLDFSSEDSCRFNSLEEINLGTPSEVSDTQDITSMVVDPDGKGMEDHWSLSAYALLTGLVLHVLYKARASGGTASLTDVAAALSDPSHPADELWAEMVANAHLGGERHPVVAAAGRDMLNKPPDERGSVLSTAISYLSLYRDPIVSRNVARSDFHIVDLMNWTTPVSLYLVATPKSKDRLRPIMRLVVNQLVRGLLGVRIGEAAHKHRLALILDEFPSYGKLDIFKESLAYMAGYGLKAFLITQDSEQLIGAYGREAALSIVANCHIRTAYAPNLTETAKWLSEMLGTATVVKEDVTASGKRFGAVLESVSRSYSQVSRPLMTPDEVMRLKAPTKNPAGDEITAPGDMLVFISGQAPIFGTQILYFQDPVFADRAKLKAPPRSDVLREEPSEVSNDGTPKAFSLEAASSELESR